MAAAGLAQVNPAMVATGEWRHANQYAVYLVHERVPSAPPRAPVMPARARLSLLRAVPSV